MEAILETAKSIGLSIAEVILVLFFCINYLKSALARTDISKGVKEQNNVDLDMVNAMENLKELVNADRVLLFEFHNGQHYSSHRNALKMSVTYEVFRAGLISAREQCSGIPISVMPRFVKKITDEGRFVCTDLEELKEDMGSTYEFKSNLGIKSFYDVALKNEKGEVIGFIAVQWNSAMPDMPMDEPIYRLAWYLEEQLKKIVSKDKKNREKK